MEVRSFAEEILLATSLNSKRLIVSDALTDLDPQYTKPLPRYPGRPPQMALDEHKIQTTKIPFPKLTTMHRPEIRAQVLHFFANHELLAMELMALALLKFPDSPAEFRQGIVATIKEEQQHLALYEQRMEELGMYLGAIAVNDFFWHCLSKMPTPFDFVVGMSMTFEQANLDFAKFYSQIFHDVGDHKTAELMNQVYEDEIGHVKHGVTWFNRWRDGTASEFDSYKNSLQLPLTPGRARGPIFDVGARQRAGLGTDYIDQLKLYADNRSLKPRYLFFNYAAEESRVTTTTINVDRPKWLRHLYSDLALLPLALSQRSDVVWVPELPRREHLLQLQNYGLVIPQFVTEHPKERIDILPWSNSEEIRGLCSRITIPHKYNTTDHESQSLIPQGFHDKTRVIALRQQLRAENPMLYDFPEEWDGIAASSMSEIENYVTKIFARFGLHAVIKIPQSSAGRHQLQIRQGRYVEHTAAIEKLLQRHEKLLIEPWLNRVLDFSAVYAKIPPKLNPKPHIMRTLVTPKGQYLGHVLRDPCFELNTSMRQWLMQPSDRESIPPWEKIACVAGLVERLLKSQGYDGPLGIDGFVFIDPKGTLRLQSLCETNQRLTMGMIAKGFSDLIPAGIPAIFWLAAVNSLNDTSLHKLDELNKNLVINASGQWFDGIVFLGDRKLAKTHVPLVAVGKAACSLVCQILA